MVMLLRWFERATFHLSGSDPQIPYFLENGPHVPTQTVHPIPAAAGQPAVPERQLVKPVTDWNDEDRRLVNIDTKARSLIAMSLPDDVFHSVCHLRSAKEIWDTLCVQYEGTAVLMESRKIFLVRQYESFIHQKDETLSQLHQRFNCLLIDLKTIGTTYSNSEVVTKFMEALPEHWEIYTSCLTMSKDIKTLTLSELYGILLNREQQKKLKKNLIRDSKDTKSNSVALVSDSVPTVAISSSVTITELESSDSDMSEDPEFNESLALLTRSFKKFAKKGNFHKKKHLTITNKPKSDPVDKATAICYNCQGKGHFANDCRYRKSQFAPSSAKSSSKNPKYQRLKEKYKKMKTQRKGKGLIAEDCDGDDVSSDDSSDEEDTQVALMAIIEEPTLALMAKIEEVPEEIPTQVPEASSSTSEASTSATDSSSQVPIPLIPLESLTQLDLVTLDLYKALNGKTSAEKMNIDLKGQLKECQEKIKQLTILEENYKDQVTVNKTLCIEREMALAAKEKALAQLNAEKVTIKGWSDASEKVDEILASGRSDKSKRGLGFTHRYKYEETKYESSMLKFGKFVSSIPIPNASENIPSSSNTHSEGAPKSKKNIVKEKSKTVTPSKTKSPKPKNKVLGGGPSVSGSKSFSQNLAPRLKIDLKQKTQEKKPIPPMSNAKGILGAGPTHLKFKNFLDHTKLFQYRKCYHCGLNDHIASKCPDATKAEKSAKVKKVPKTEKSVKGKKVVKTVPSVKTPASRTDKSDKGIWYLDSGCSRHMTGSKSVLSNYREERGPDVTFGGNGKGQTRGYGTLTNGVTTFKRVAYVEGLMHNLLSISQLCDKNHKVSFSKKKCKVKNRRKEVILTSCTPMKTPMAPPLTLDKDSKGKAVDVTLYRGMIGSLLYLTASRPDIMYSTCLCARYQAEPKESHLTAVKRIFRYLKGTPNLGLWYSKDSGFDLTAYSDSDFAGCKIDRKSTTGGCHLLGGKLVSWTSKKQNSVSTSTTEAEYVAAGICCAQVLWLRNQLQDYDIQLSKIPIYCDNTSAIAIANNPVLHSKTKHIEVRYHFIRDHVMNGDIELHFVPTEYQLADLFTKPLDVTRFNMLISELGMLNPDD
ncbi:hypothetical protein OSB04_017276 [Centaurea solstitialis]|uniref:CCHC-type domain-containing protein n=1 Tax=Centaurea solstitialis TaxID=347529 RepID=A0AA38TFS2_9ASTR|nr:hypothetical protein OSB04_017276 [Centaurea solstitialis]